MRVGETFAQDRDLVDSILSDLHRQRPQEECAVTFVVRLYSEEHLAAQRVAYLVRQGLVVSLGRTPVVLPCFLSECKSQAPRRTRHAVPSLRSQSYVVPLLPRLRVNERSLGTWLWYPRSSKDLNICINPPSVAMSTVACGVG